MGVVEYAAGACGMPCHHRTPARRPSRAGMATRQVAKRRNAPRGMREPLHERAHPWYGGSGKATAEVGVDHLIGVLQEELACPDSSWSIGSFGAIGEFHQDAGEPLLVDQPARFTRATARGAIQLEPRADVRACAYECLSADPRRWNQALALCLPTAQARRAQRTVLTELGPDDAAIRPGDRDDILFDLGLAQPHIDFCIRTRDAALLEVLRAACGQPTFATAAGRALLAAHPHRVVISNLGRTEIYQKIGGPETDDVSPAGPHTHVLPKLLASGRTHAANIPLPPGTLACATLHPAHPVTTTTGHERAFEARAAARFESYLEHYGPPGYLDTKRQVWAALAAGSAPARFSPPATRLARTAVRNALRQAARECEARDDRARAAQVAAWRACFDAVRPRAAVVACG